LTRGGWRIIGRPLPRTLPVALLCAFCAAPGLGGAERRLLAYYSSSSRRANPPYSAANIPYDQLTHIDHAFLRLSAKNDGSLDVSPSLLEPELISRAHAAGVRVMISIGGGGASRPFAAVTADPAARANMVRNVRDFVIQNGYDGVDLDWEYPDGVEERSHCTLLMAALRKELPAPKYQLSMATPADPNRPGQGSYDLEALAQILDFFNVMTYDLHGPWSKHAGHNSPLFPNPADPGHSRASLASAIDIYLDYFHIPPDKLNIGTGFYGYEFTTAQDLWGACDCARTTFARGYGTYIKQRIGQMGWKRYYDSEAQAPYLLRESRSEPGVITYDDPESIANKVNYVLGTRGLGGFFTWVLGSPNGDYDGQSQDLLAAMHAAFAKYQSAAAPAAK
jgi:chitinase